MLIGPIIILAVWSITEYSGYGWVGRHSAKAPRQDPNWKHCLCHVRPVYGELTPFTAAIELEKKLQESAEQSQDDVHEQLKHTRTMVQREYHRPCYQTYINKTLIKRLQDKRERRCWASEQASTSAQADSSTNVREVDRESRKTWNTEAMTDYPGKPDIPITGRAERRSAKNYSSNKKQRLDRYRSEVSQNMLR